MSDVQKLEIPHAQALYQELIGVLKKHSLPPQETLAIVSNVVGKLIAMQHVDEIAIADVIALINRNIQEGNQEAIVAAISMDAPSEEEHQRYMLAALDTKGSA